MLLNLTAVYGLRAMAVLAELEPGESINADQLSERTGVPRQYLSKVMRKLVVARLVRGQRGRGGGFALQRPRSKIRLADVLAALDLEMKAGCAFDFEACDVHNPCTLHPIWSRLQESLATWTTKTTMADLGAAPKRGAPAVASRRTGTRRRSD
ncbi:MAG TPA: Rrf2 family transcriptional regulator [Planctomycetota bacterium]|nr:Rrf2 family transcriptional regulator [Planctomycetota bacterium]